MIDFLLRPVRRNFGKDKVYYRIVDDLFGFVAHNIELFKLALIHKSASLVLDGGNAINNERLEFLGDAVIEAVTSDYLYIEFPDRDEGFLTQLRAKIVSRQALNAIAESIGLDRYLITHSAGDANKHLPGDTFEAMMGAIYLDQGYNFVNRLLIGRIFADCISLDELCDSETDFKSRLIEWCQKTHRRIRFTTKMESKKGHPGFRSTVLIDDMAVGYGAGESKKAAEQQACFSVSQTLDDEACIAVLDKLDKLDPVGS